MGIISWKMRASCVELTLYNFSTEGETSFVFYLLWSFTATKHFFSCHDSISGTFPPFISLLEYSHPPPIPHLVLTSPEGCFSCLVLSTHPGSHFRGIVFHLPLRRWNTSLLETSTWQATSSLVLIDILRLSHPACELPSSFFLHFFLGCPVQCKWRF